MTDETAKPAPQHALAVRIAIGLAQGLALYWLDRTHQRIEQVWLGALQLAAWLAPIVALGAYGATRRRTFLVWVAAATLIAAGLGGYGAYVREGQFAADWMAPPMALFVAAALFILHHLLLPAEAERRWRAGYERYFDDGWKDAIRLALSGVFVGALWALLFLGASLFQVIGLDFLERLIRQEWFAYLTTTVFFAVAVHVTDVRAGLVRGARTLVLTLLAWLLPILTLIAGGFLLALPFTGLKVLWGTHAASGTMLAACAALIVLINANYQDGEGDGFPPRFLRWVGRAAGALLAPLVALAAYGVMLRVGQHGLTPSRIYALACVVVAACYAAGYAWAAFAKGGWLKPLELTNWVTAQVAVAAVLILFSPVGDPERYSVDSQVARLASGRIKPEAFDYGFLHFRSGRWGRAALKRLEDPKAAPPGVAVLALAEQRNKFPTDAIPGVAISNAERAKVIQAVGGPLPEGFLTQVWSSIDDPAFLCRNAPAPCPAITVDLGQGPGPQVVVFWVGQRSVYGLRSGHWERIGELTGPNCGDDMSDIAHGRFRVTPPEIRRDLEVGGRRLSFVPQVQCPQQAVVTGDGYYQSTTVHEDVTDVAIVKPAPAKTH